MKKIFAILALAALTIVLFWSCAKNYDEDIETLKRRVSNLEDTGTVATVEKQVEAMKVSITDLEAANKAINGRIDGLKSVADAQQALIDALKEADGALAKKDEALENRIVALESQETALKGQIEKLVSADSAINKRIDELSSYVDGEIKKTTDWANATFATMSQYYGTADELAALSSTVSGINTVLTQTQTDIAAINTRIDGLNNAALDEKIDAVKTELEGKIGALKTELEGNIATAVSNSEASIQGWVNTQLGGYWTAILAEQKLADLKTQIAADIAAGDQQNADKIEEAQTEIADLKDSLAAAKTQLTAAYTQAITDAINQFDGTIVDQIRTELTAANAQINALAASVSTLEADVENLKTDVAGIKAMIQSVTVIPAYSDGNVESTHAGLLLMNFVVAPAEAVKGVTKDNIKVLVDKVKTKAASYTILSVETAEVNETTGDVEITADISSMLPVADGKAVIVAVNIKNGISNFISGFVPVTFLTSGALFGDFSVSATQRVHFSQGNLYWDGSTFKFEDNQYGFKDSWDASHVSHFYWSETASVSYAQSFSESHYAYDDVFFINETENTAKTDFTVNGVTGKYRVLSQPEWEYLLKNRTMKSGGDRYSLNITYNGKKGLVLYPDDYAGPALSGTVTVLPVGVVFLPAAGRRTGTAVSEVGSAGYYWSSSPENLTLASAKLVFFEDDAVTPWGCRVRELGCSVRLITECQ